MPMPLTDTDLHTLETESWSDRSTVKAFDLYRVNTYEGAELTGQRANEDYAGIVFPMRWPGDSNPRAIILRRDHPPMENGKPKRKYIAEPGRGNIIWFGPGESPEALADVQLPVVLTEGPKKLCALWRLARYDSEHPRFLACAISGVWNWRGVIGKTTDASGARVDEKGVIPDFGRITWAGRVVVVVLDSDCLTNPSVAAARRGLIAELRRQGARVVVVDLPVSDGLNG